MVLYLMIPQAAAIREWRNRLERSPLSPERMYTLVWNMTGSEKQAEKAHNDFLIERSKQFTREQAVRRGEIFYEEE